MNPQLHQVLTFENVPANSTAVLPYNLNFNGTKRFVPDLVFLATPNSDVSAITATDLTISNLAGFAQTITVWLYGLHTQDRVFGGTVTNLTPNPLVIHGGSSTASGGLQSFQYTANGAEGASFNVALPVARTNNFYNILASNATVTTALIFEFPNAGRTTTQFQVDTSVAVTAGDIFDFVIVDRTA